VIDYFIATSPILVVAIILCSADAAAHRLRPERAMSSFTKLSMRFTTNCVACARTGLDMANVAIYTVQGPLRRAFEKYGGEAPWIFAMTGTFGCIVTPMFLYPIFAPIWTPDPRRIKEQERVRECLQQGVDPHPYLKHRDKVFGVGMPVKVVGDDVVPQSASEEWRVMHRFKNEKDTFLIAEKSEEHAAIDKLERADKPATQTGINKWLAVNMGTEAGKEIVARDNIRPAVEQRKLA
jgi:hypothetical protein